MSNAREAIASLYFDGLGHAAIVRRTGYSASMVDYHLTVLGACPARSTSQRTYQRRGRAVRPFLPAEDAFIAARRDEGWSLPKIAKGCAAFGAARAVSSVYMRLLKLAAAEDEV